MRSALEAQDEIADTDAARESGLGGSACDLVAHLTFDALFYWWLFFLIGPRWRIVRLSGSGEGAADVG